MVCLETEDKLNGGYILYDQIKNKGYNFYSLRVDIVNEVFETMYITMTANTFYSIGKINNLFSMHFNGNRVASMKNLEWMWTNQKYPKVFRLYVDII